MIPLPSVTKTNGADNTFALIDDGPNSSFSVWEKANPIPRPHLARQICDIKKGIAVDGVLWLRPGPRKFSYVWDFYNADGSSAEMCGNAARCAGVFAYSKLGVSLDQDLTFLTPAGEVLVRQQAPGLFTAQMTAVQKKQSPLALTTADGIFQGHLIDSGVPHFVISVESLKDLTKEICRSLRHHVTLAPAGANVTLLKAQGPDRGEAVTYERGVEDFTSACGTGAVAAAFVLRGRSGPEQIQIQMPGGSLVVDLGSPRPLLTGPAFIVGDFQFTEGILHWKS